MKTSSLFACLALLGIGGLVRASDPVRVAIFAFQSDAKLKAAYGTAVANLVQAGLSVLEPLQLPLSRPETGGLSFDDSPSAPLAAELGRRFHAEALVTGRILRSGAQLILAAKVIDTATGSALGTSVEGRVDAPITALAAELGIRVGGVIVHETAAQAHARWPDASIRGWSDSLPADVGGLFRSSERVVLTAIDGRPIGNAAHGLDQARPLVPGRHSFSAAYAQGGEGAVFEFYFDAHPGTGYGLRGSAKRDHAQIWVVAGNSTSPVPLIVASRTGLSSATALETTLSRPGPESVIDTRMLRD